MFLPSRVQRKRSSQGKRKSVSLVGHHQKLYNADRKQRVAVTPRRCRSLVKEVLPRPAKGTFSPFGHFCDFAVKGVSMTYHNAGT